MRGDTNCGGSNFPANRVGEITHLSKEIDNTYLLCNGAQYYINEYPILANYMPKMVDANLEWELSAEPLQGYDNYRIFPKSKDEYYVFASSFVASKNDYTMYTTKNFIDFEIFGRQQDTWYAITDYINGTFFARYANDLYSSVDAVNFVLRMNLGSASTMGDIIDFNGTLCVLIHTSSRNSYHVSISTDNGINWISAGGTNFTSNGANGLWLYNDYLYIIDESSICRTSDLSSWETVGKCPEYIESPGDGFIQLTSTQWVVYAYFARLDRHTFYTTPDFQTWIQRKQYRANPNFVLNSNNNMLYYADNILWSASTETGTTQIIYSNDNGNSYNTLPLLTYNLYSVTIYNNIIYAVTDHTAGAYYTYTTDKSILFSIPNYNMSYYIKSMN